MLNWERIRSWMLWAPWRVFRLVEFLSRLHPSYAHLTLYLIFRVFEKCSWKIGCYLDLHPYTPIFGDNAVRFPRNNNGNTSISFSYLSYKQKYYKKLQAKKLQKYRLSVTQVAGKLRFYRPLCKALRIA